LLPIGRPMKHLALLRMLMPLALLAGCAPAPHRAVSPAAAGDDPWLWLEDIHGAKPMEWVEAHNAQTRTAFAQTPAFETTRRDILEVLDSEAKIPGVQKIGDRYYNFWKDKEHPRGVWRRTTLEQYRRNTPAWETVIDVDALGQTEGKHWVWHGAQCLKPENRRCLVALSPGGGDADVVREFDLVDKAFVAFQLQKRRLDLYRTGVLTKVNTIQNLTEYSLRAGESSILDLLDVIRTRRDTLAGFYQALFDYQSALLDLELATATPLLK